MIAIIDYGLGNLASVQNMFRKAGAEVKIVSSVSDVVCADSLVLPGVGAFDSGVKLLRSRGLWTALQDSVSKGTPILGICLGMQLLTDGSEEGELPGLALVPGFARRFDIKDQAAFKVPHMGWNVVEVAKANPLIEIVDAVTKFYFVHSYHVVLANKDDELARSVHELGFTAAFQKDMVFGTQFHPEKSHKYGMALMRNFAFLCRRSTRS